MSLYDNVDANPEEEPLYQLADGSAVVVNNPLFEYVATSDQRSDEELYQLTDAPTNLKPVFTSVFDDLTWDAMIPGSRAKTYTDEATAVSLRAIRGFCNVDFRDTNPIAAVMRGVLRTALDKPPSSGFLALDYESPLVKYDAYRIVTPDGTPAGSAHYIDKQLVMITVANGARDQAFLVREMSINYEHDVSHTFHVWFGDFTLLNKSTSSVPDAIWEQIYPDVSQSVRQSCVAHMRDVRSNPHGLSNAWKKEQKSLVVMMLFLSQLRAFEDAEPD